MNGMFKQFLAIALLVAIAPSTASAGGLLMTIAGYQESGGSGSFEVVLENTEHVGGASFDIRGFSFEVVAPSGSSMIFTDTSYATVVAPYIFAGTGQSGFSDPSSPLYIPGFPEIPLTFDTPGADINGSDASLVAPYVTTLNPGDTFSLGLVTFTADPSEPPSGLVPILKAAGCSLTALDESSIPFSLPYAATPEPSSLAMVVISSALLLGARRRAD